MLVSFAIVSRWQTFPEEHLWNHVVGSTSAVFCGPRSAGAHEFGVSRLSLVISVRKGVGDVLVRHCWA